MVEIYTDGSYSIPRHIGGWSVVITKDGKYFDSISQEISKGTSNRAELLALIRALEIAQEEKEVIIYSDSMYIVKGYKTWVNQWSKNNWTNFNGKQTQNADLWRKVLVLKKEHITVKWVKRNTCQFNILADSLAGY